MPNKFFYYAEMADNHAQYVASSPANWMDMLKMASRLYKYPFDEQLLIHAQRPDATACANYETWNKTMKRYVKRDTKGIALLDTASGTRRLKYVFDVSDTGAGRADAKLPRLWQVTPETEYIVREIITNRMPYESIVSNTLTIEELIHHYALHIAHSYVVENQSDILQALEGSTMSKFEPTTEGQREAIRLFTHELIDSTAFTIMQRCGINGEKALASAYEGDEDTPFQHIGKFDTPSALKSLGVGVSTLSEGVLREIELLIKRRENAKLITAQIEGSNSDGRTTTRTELHSRRGLPNSRHQNTRGGSETTISGQVRNDAHELSEESPQNNLHKYESGRGVVSTLSGIGNASQSTIGNNDVAVGGEIPTTKQSDRPDGLGISYEQSESPSGGSNQGRDSLQLNDEVPPTQGGIFNAPQTVAQLTIEMFPSEIQQREEITNEEQSEHADNAITPEDINNAIVQWNGSAESKTRVYEHMYKNARALDTAQFLKQEYGNNLQGITITKEGAGSLLLSWDKVQKCIGILIDEERFLPPVQLSPETAETSHQLETKFENTESQPSTNTIIAAQNFRITNPHLGEGGPKTKYNYNIEAIRTLQIIEAEGRTATPDEQQILSCYVGWGGIQQAFDESSQGWAKEYEELRALLSPAEYESARASTLNAHYTSPTVISAMYEALERLGVKGGNILEPSCGAGNFLGLLPDSMQNANLYGVELDSITGRIAKQLYPNADIKVMGFEKTQMPDSFFDVAIGNVPFGGFSVIDKKYDKHNFMIHDYFFAKSLDQVRPGGIVAFVTSKGTLDKSNSKVRKYLAERADLLGAVRLPNNAFLKNAGTEVTSDIIFLQKRDTIQATVPDWVHLSETESGIPINSYFVDNPQMILGTMTTDSGNRMYGREDAATCIPIEGADLSEQLRKALLHITGQITAVSHDDIIDDAPHHAIIPADPTIKNFSYAKTKNGDLYFRENSHMYLVNKPAATMARISGMVDLRDCTRKLIDMQLENYSDEEIQKQQAVLNHLYDNFTKKHGLINSTANARAFDEDSSYYLLASLEDIDDDGKLERKSDIFTKRTIKYEKKITSVDTSTEALAISIAQKARVNMPFMTELTGFTEEKIATDLRGIIFELPNLLTPNGEKIYVTADEYLSGNVREKLAEARIAAADNPIFEVNVNALEQAQPKALDASEISVRIGSTWVDKEYYSQFMYELLKTPANLKDAIGLHYSEATGEWSISGKTIVRADDVLARTTYGTIRANAYAILEQSLNLRDIRIYDISEENGKIIRTLNKKDTILAQQKQEAIKQAFKEWIFKDPDRRQALVAKYNTLFNSTRPRQFDGSHIEFAGASPEISLRPHQRGAIARILYGGNTLLAHEVGAGKSFEMIGAAMESKRLGLCNKSLFVVPNHIIEDMASEFLRLYPAANVLVANKKDFEQKNRKKFCARIATGEYDAIIIGHSQFEKIPLSKERQELIIRDEIHNITAGIEAAKREKGERFTIKQMEKLKKSLETRLAKLTDDSRKDDVVTFEQLGVDRLFVDEAHNYKNL